MTDHELLEFAAKAAGVKYEHRYQTPNGVEFAGLLLDHGYANYPPVFWNPLTDDGDALRLAVSLKLLVDGCSHCAMTTKEDIGWCYGGSGDDKFAATRRAIVRAAAEIGKAMP